MQGGNAIKMASRGSGKPAADSVKKDTEEAKRVTYKARIFYDNMFPLKYVSLYLFRQFCPLNLWE